MTMARILKSGVTGNCYAPFGSGAGAGDRPGDHNMAQVESRMGLGDGGPALDSGQLLALVDSLFSGTLNDAQKETVQALRTGILALAEMEAQMV
jgi:hypothetical protein